MKEKNQYCDECCGNCRHEEKDGFDPDEVIYDSGDHESFNGA